MMESLSFNKEAIVSSPEITRKSWLQRWLLRVIPYAMNNEKSATVTKTKAKTTNRSSKQIRWENFFRNALVWIAVAMVVLMLGVFVTLCIQSIPSFKALGLKYLWGRTWDPVNEVYGAWPFLIGTLLTSFTALIISIPFSFAVAIFLGEYYPNGWLSNFLRNAVELIAAVPSVIYGFWGLFVLVPIVRKLESGIGAPPFGVGIFSASLVLAIMVIPYAASLSRELIRLVPSHLKEGAYALGATRYEVIMKVILPYTKSGLLAGVLLSLGRALGETMAVTMVIGNSSAIPSGKFFLFGPGNTMASVIANEFTEAATTTYLSALIELGLVLFLVTVVINMIGKRIISRFTNE
ncbi:MAG TPA: phosphate ABC transporter permease subunit PstC [Dinghuibacter sp.]|uniref:phosphate ABC transporter permease subunit PstC n=1 Tax=Dinghuibacter sp. TaxID=2024697 RepID=UPI002BE283B8|nr:phosphate ABC transporter permease subunit PstC [Dinghuibacter sp.]HTJ14506.1 phosphate ABC transporter permease subunit PstC [Dinghuibacter sp.]